MDASLQGLVGVCDNQVYAVSVDSYYNSMSNINIVHLEMLNVLVALRLWVRHLEGKVVHLHCDNFAVVNVLRCNLYSGPTFSVVYWNQS